MKHLKLFQKESDYQSFIESDSFVTPNVSFVKEENIVFFNPYEEPEEPSIPNNVIKYKASEKLTETTNAFNTTIVSHEFANGVGTITFEEDVTSIGDYAFRYCLSLTSIVIPDSVTSIGSCAFQSCSKLTSIVIPDSVTSIRDYAFSYCSGLTSVTIGSGVTSIEDYAFLECSELRDITCHAVVAPTIQSGTFYHIKSNGVLYYPSGSNYSSWLSELGSNWTGQEI